MNKWSLSELLGSLHDEIQHRLSMNRRVMGQPVVKGDGAEVIWRRLLQDHLPKRYRVERATVVDSHGAFSDHIDVVIFDEQYSPFLLRRDEQYVVPAESVYAVFEAKQTVSADEVKYAHGKIASVRKLHRTSLPIPSAGGLLPPKAIVPIIGGLVTLASDWSPPLGETLLRALDSADEASQMDLGCVATHGIFKRDESGAFMVAPGGKPATSFVFQLIALLQNRATVPMIDVNAYAKWLG